MRETLVKTEEFKDSPLGKIPADWEVLPVRTFANVIRGASPRPKGDPLYYGGCVPRLMVEDVTRDGKWVTPRVDSLTIAGAKLSRPLKKGDFVIVCSGTVGIPCLLAVNACIHDGFLGLIHIDETKVSKDYLYLWFSSVQQKMDASATHGGVFTNLTTQILRDALVVLPKIQEQRAITTVIDTIDSTIAHTSSLIAKLKQMKAGLLHDLLTRGLDENGELRDGIGHPEHFKDSPLGQIPKDWEAQILGQVLICIDAGKSPNCPDTPATAGEWGVLKVSAVHPNGFKPEENKVITNPTFINPIYEVKNGDLLITRSNTYELVGLTCLVENPPPRLLLCDKTLRLNVDNQRACTELMAYIIQTPFVRSQIQINATGSSAGMKNISQEIIRNILVALPKERDEQERIVTILNSYDTRIRTEEAYRDKLKLQKKGLMHDLLTGKVRVKDADKFTPCK